MCKCKTKCNCKSVGILGVNLLKTNQVIANKALPNIGTDKGALLSTILDAIDDKINNSGGGDVVIENIGTGAKWYKGKFVNGRHQFKTLRSLSSLIDITEEENEVHITTSLKELKKETVIFEYDGTTNTFQLPLETENIDIVTINHTPTFEFTFQESTKELTVNFPLYYEDQVNVRIERATL